MHLLLCMPASAADPATTARPARAMLSVEQAAMRAARVSEVSYDLALSLGDTAPDFNGTVNMDFQLTDAADDLTLDFTGGAVTSLMVNGAPARIEYNGYFLTLHSTTLRPGHNRVAVTFSHPYSNDGSGLYRFQDPEDQRWYLYSDFEPYDQNRLFPAFDQPDIKARLKSEITVPEGWSVVANTPVEEVTKAGAMSRWRFPATPPLSTYLFAVHAGQYEVFTDNAGTIPLRLFVRASLARYVDPAQWFTVTRQGLAYYQDYFASPYPFAKYDQLIVPHFNAGAMENVGAVTFSERFIQRGESTRQNRATQAYVILHEMAHMWFGDLVTMRWWDGLWLNESFATFMGMQAMTAATEFTDASEDAFRSKIGAYRADERDTTHAIDLPVADTDTAFANFDAITYNKGAAVLNQLHHYVGPATFQRGIGDYLSRHAWSNTTLEDFLAAIANASGTNLEGWAQDWLRTPGTNGITVDVQCSDGSIQSLSLLQSAPARWPVLRTHRAAIGLYYGQDETVEVTALPVTYTGERTAVEAAAGRACPDFIYPNVEDWDFARVRLDRTQLRFIERHLAHMEDSLTRSMWWHSVWDMVQDGRLPLSEYVAFVADNLLQEADDDVLQQVLDTLLDTVNYLSVRGSDPAQTAARVERLLWQGLDTGELRGDRALLLWDTFVASVTTQAGSLRLHDLLVGDLALPAGITLDQDRRWRVLQQLAATGDRAVRRLLDAERERDGSDAGALRALAVEAARPQQVEKQRWIDQVLSADNPFSLAQTRAVMRALFPALQQQTLEQLSPSLMTALAQQMTHRDTEYVSTLASGFIRAGCSEDYAAALARTAAEPAMSSPLVARRLADARFETLRCVQIMEAAATD